MKNMVERKRNGKRKKERKKERCKKVEGNRN